MNVNLGWISKAKTADGTSKYSTLNASAFGSQVVLNLTCIRYKMKKEDPIKKIFMNEL